eukprot:g32073.t1
MQLTTQSLLPARRCCGTSRLKELPRGSCGSCLQGYYGVVGPVFGPSPPVCTPVNCPAGTQGQVGATTASGCVACAGGKYSSGGASLCQDVFCDPGYTSKSTTGLFLKDCEVCPSGKYSTGGLPASTVCQNVNCPSGWVPKPQGVPAVSATDCNQTCTSSFCGAIGGYVYELKSPVLCAVEAAITGSAARNPVPRTNAKILL